jgi:hypothetical protein
MLKTCLDGFEFGGAISDVLFEFFSYVISLTVALSNVACDHCQLLLDPLHSGHQVYARCNHALRDIAPLGRVLYHSGHGERPWICLSDLQN